MKKLVLLLAMMCFTPAFGVNMLVNGDFETGDTTGWAPRFGGGSISAVQENPTPHGGQYCCKQTGRSETWHGTIHDMNMLDVLERGESYPYSAWVRTSSATPVNVALTMQSDGGSATRYLNVTNVSADNTAWFHIEGDYIFPADDDGTTYTFYFEVTGSANAELYLDDVVLGTLAPINAAYDPFVEPYMEAGETVGTPTTTDDVNYFIEDLILNFKAGVNPDTMTGIDPSIKKHNIYLTSKLPDDPNLYLIATLDQTSTTDPNQKLILADLNDPLVLNAGTTYSWQVKQIIQEKTGVLADDDPNNILGEVWEFTTTSPVPIILGITDHVLTDETATASFTVTVSATGNHYQWFKVVGAVDSIENGETNDVKLADGGDYSGTTTKTLNITGIAADGSDDARYYALAYNGAPELITSTVSAPSAVRWVWAPNLMSHFDFNTLTSDQVTDSVSGYVATLGSIVAEDATAVTPSSLIAGDPDLAGNALSFGGNTGTSSTTGNFAAMTAGVVSYKDITISAWVKWNGGNGWQRIIDCGADTNNYIFLSPGNGTDGGSCVFALKRNGTEASISTTALPIGEWTYVTATLSGDTARLYVNGTYKSKGTITFNPVDIISTNNYLARSQWPDPLFNGAIDDLMIYNYARTNEQIANDYMAVKGEYVEFICDMELYDLDYDFNDDCIVDILDFAEFAATWMDSFRIYPAQE